MVFHKVLRLIPETSKFLTRVRTIVPLNEHASFMVLPFLINFEHLRIHSMPYLLFKIALFKIIHSMPYLLFKIAPLNYSWCLIHSMPYYLK